MTGPDNREPQLTQNFAVEDLLCGDCEQRFSRWESDAARIFNQRETFDLPPLPPNVCYENEGLGYTNTKLYLLSLLWRMSVSSLPEFRPVNLGPHEERIRRQLLSANPGRPEDYGCILQVVIDSKGRIPVTRPADKYRVNQDMIQYRLLLDGFLLTWCVGSSEASARCELKSFFLQENGTWSSRVVPRNKIPFLHAALSGILEQGL